MGTMDGACMQGLPLNLAGVRRIMEAMDWGDLVDFVGFGNVGADQIDDARFYLLVAPQNVVGSTIMTKLLEMVGGLLCARPPAAVLLCSPSLRVIDPWPLM